MWELVFFVAMAFMVVAVFTSKASVPKASSATPLGIIPREKLADCAAPETVLAEGAPAQHVQAAHITPQQVMQIHRAGMQLGRQGFIHQLYNPSMN